MPNRDKRAVARFRRAHRSVPGPSFIGRIFSQISSGASFCNSLARTRETGKPAVGSNAFKDSRNFRWIPFEAEIVVFPARPDVRCKELR